MDYFEWFDYRRKKCLVCGWVRFYRSVKSGVARLSPVPADLVACLADSHDKPLCLSLNLSVCLSVSLCSSHTSPSLYQISFFNISYLKYISVFLFLFISFRSCSPVCLSLFTLALFMSLHLTQIVKAHFTQTIFLYLFLSFCMLPLSLSLLLYFSLSLTQIQMPLNLFSNHFDVFANI